MPSPHRIGRDRWGTLLQMLARDDDPVIHARLALRRRAVLAIVGVFLLFVLSVLTPLGQLFSDLILTGRPTDDPDRIAAAKDVLDQIGRAHV